MKYMSVFLAGVMFFLLSCEGEGPSSGSYDRHSFRPDSVANAEFDTYKHVFLEEWWQYFPEWATEMGHHKNDSLLSIPDKAFQERKISFIIQHLESLSGMDTFLLSWENYIDYRIIRHELGRILWASETLKEHEWNPALYNITGVIAFMLTEQYAPLEDRLKMIGRRLSQVPAYYRHGEEHIKNAVPELAQLAIEQNRGGAEILREALRDSVSASGLSSLEKSEIQKLAAEALHAVNKYTHFLEQNKEHYTRSFRLGQEVYEAKYAWEIQSEHTAEEMYVKALGRADFIHGEMYKIADSLWSRYYTSEKKPVDSLQLIRQVLDTIASGHVSAEAFQAAIEKQIPALETFVRDNNLLYLDPTKPLVVRKEPGHLTGIAGASISAPGPYDSMGNTYYNVGTFTGWAPEAIESYLREYNHYTLQILNIHEAVPGHYTQLVYANKAASTIKAIFGNNAMIEGWAVYTEQMMLENGYGDNAPEMWLMWYKWNLRTVFNMILDYEIHTKGLQEDEAVTKLMAEAFQEKTEAVNKWRRASVTNIQLTSYYTGYEEIIELRERYKQKMSASYRLNLFNEAFLGMGSIPVKYIKETLLGA